MRDAPEQLPPSAHIVRGSRPSQRRSLPDTLAARQRVVEIIGLCQQVREAGRLPFGQEPTRRWTCL